MQAWRLRACSFEGAESPWRPNRVVSSRPRPAASAQTTFPLSPFGRRLAHGSADVPASGHLAEVL